MRTTLNIADDVLIAVRERARRDGTSVGELISDLARQALTGRGKPGNDHAESSFHGFDPLPNRGPTVSNDLIDRLREEDDG
ncbi:MAG: CopG family transcriptional regulator [Euzebya sp.]